MIYSMFREVNSANFMSMKHVVLLSFTLALLITACRKVSNDTTYPLPANTWQVRDTKFEEHSSQWLKEKVMPATDSVTSLYVGTDSGYPSAIVLRFTHRPIAAQTFKVVASPSADDEVAIQTYQDYSSNAYSQDDTGMYVTATPVNGVMTFTSDNVKLKSVGWVSSSFPNCKMNITE